MKKFLLLFFLIATCQNIVEGQEKTVTLIVNGQGKTNDEAKQSAFRNALEQAFGTFISSKTEILNDQLVSDEIISVSNGNIQNFDVISETQTPNAGYATTLRVTVSVTKLILLAESKGVTIEFNGNMLAANIKQQILNEENEIKSMQNVANTCKGILDYSCDFELNKSGEPTQNSKNEWAVPLIVNVKFNKNTEQFKQYLFNSIDGLSMSNDEVEQYELLGKKTYKIALCDGGNGGITEDFKSLKIISKDNPNLKFMIYAANIQNDEYFYRHYDNYNELKKDLAWNISEENSKLKVRYFEKPTKSIFHFRSLQSIVILIDLINYTKHSISNFELSNGLKTIESRELEIINNQLKPILNIDGNSFNSNTLYSKMASYSKSYFFEKLDKYYILTNKGYSFYFPEVMNNSNYYAIISLFDFKPNDEAIISFYFKDILKLSDLEKVQEYKINPTRK